MDDPLKSLESAAVESSDVLWYGFAKAGKEIAILAPLGQYPGAAAWLTEKLSKEHRYITRKLGAMLAGWVHDPKHVGLLSQMLDRERQVFRDDPLSANSVGEDIMFAATRWMDSPNPQVKGAGTNVLARMIWDAMEGTPWNTSHWAAANLYGATDGKHPIFEILVNSTDKQFSWKDKNSLRTLSKP
jgi:hypothetical protein